jgi:hypothetical protein
MADETSKIIYHYCSLEAFYSIITNKSFWLFSLSSTNDLDELNEAEKILIEILNEEKYKSIKKPNVNKNEEFYSLSCTCKKDNDSHFDKYADKNKGVCFGIDTEVFRRYLLKSLSKDLYIGYFFFPKVFYDKKRKENEIRKYLNERLLYIDKGIKSKIIELYELLIDSSLEQNKDILRESAYKTALSHFKPKMKKINYESEAEVRMLFCRSEFQLYMNLFSKDKTSSNSLYSAFSEPAKKLTLDSSPKFTAIAGTIRKYIELNMEQIWYRQPIKEVILGPNCNTNIEEFNEFLKENKVSCEAKESEIKNRNDMKNHSFNQRSSI